MDLYYDLYVVHGNGKADALSIRDLLLDVGMGLMMQKVCVRKLLTII